MAVAACVLGVAGAGVVPAQATPTPSMAALDAASTPVWVPADGETVPCRMPATPLMTLPCGAIRRILPRHW